MIDRRRGPEPAFEATQPGPPLRFTPAETAHDALRELSDAADQFVDHTLRGTQPRRWRRSPVPFVIAMLTGAIGFVVERPEHQCAAIFRTGEKVTPARRNFFRNELQDAAWTHLQSCPESARPARWFVDTTGGTEFRLVFHHRDAAAAIESLRTAAAAYLERLQSVERSERDTPTEGETVLQDYLAELRSRLGDAQEQVEAAVAALPAADPNAKRETLREQWRRLRGGFESTRQELGDASALFERMRGEPEPEQGVVTSEEREAAIQANPSLVADLDELRVNLTELRRNAFAVVDASLPPLAALRTASEDLARVLRPESLPGADTLPQQALVDASTAANTYHELLQAFALEWEQGRHRIESSDTSPYVSDLVTLHGRARDQLTRFLFASGKFLATLRNSVGKISEQASDRAQLHVWHSDLVRGFQTLQSFHHRFEFVASRIEGAENFRLDAALRASLGLRRRTQASLESIETRLQAAATERARRQRQTEIRAAAAVVERVRDAADQTIGELVALQDAINLTSDLSEEFHRAVMRLEASTSRLQVTQASLRAVEGRLDEFQARRRRNSDGAPVQLVSCSLVENSANLAKRCRTAAGAAAMSFLAAVAAMRLQRGRTTETRASNLRPGSADGTAVLGDA